MNTVEPSPWALPEGEAERLADLYGFEILDTPPEEPFDGIAEITAALMDVPFAVLGFIDKERHWFKAKVGTTMRGTCRSIAFCGYTILSAKTLVIEDLADDPRFADHPLVVNPPYVRFYAGAPLVSHEGHCIGTLCVLDVKPRTLTQEQVRLLERLASQTVDAMESRRLLNILARGTSAIQSAVALVPSSEAKA